MKVKQTKEKGITLIGLVILIIIIVVLAIILIKLMSKNETVKDGSQIPEIGENLDRPSKWISDKVTPLKDGKGGVIPLPDGYYYVGGNIDTGIVISDKKGDTLEATYPNSGNQFVWIPVKDEEDFSRTEFEKNGTPTGQLKTEYEYTEPFSYNGRTGYLNENAEYNEMKEKVIQYGGFYIGRYEAGVASNQLRTKTTIAQEVVIQKGVAPYNYVQWGKSMNDINDDNGAVYLAKNKYSHSNSVVSTLCYGSQWDAMCRYIGDSRRSTESKKELTLTGNVSNDVSKNIYDLAGNCREWTMEASGNYYRVLRGGCYDLKGSYVSMRLLFYPKPENNYEELAFRIALYIA